MIIDIYKNVFKRVSIFSPSIEVDYQTWKPVKDYIENDLKLKETDEDQFYYSEYDAVALAKIIEAQKNSEYQKKKIIKNMENFNCY